MWHGFVTSGRGELVLSFVAVSLLMMIAGYLLAQLVAMVRRPAAPMKYTCLRLHCDNEREMNSWLRQRDYSLITNEMLHEINRPRAESTGRHARTDIWPGMAGKISEDPK